MPPRKAVADGPATRRSTRSKGPSSRAALPATGGDDEESELPAPVTTRRVTRGVGARAKKTVESEEEEEPVAVPKVTKPPTNITSTTTKTAVADDLDDLILDDSEVEGNNNKLNNNNNKTNKTGNGLLDKSFDLVGDSDPINFRMTFNQTPHKVFEQQQKELLGQKQNIPPIAASSQPTTQQPGRGRGGGGGYTNYTDASDTNHETDFFPPPRRPFLGNRLNNNPAYTSGDESSTYGDTTDGFTSHGTQNTDDFASSGTELVGVRGYRSAPAWSPHAIGNNNNNINPILNNMPPPNVRQSPFVQQHMGVPRFSSSLQQHESPQQRNKFLSCTMIWVLLILFINFAAIFLFLVRHQQGGPFPAVTTFANTVFATLGLGQGYYFAKPDAVLHPQTYDEYKLGHKTLLQDLSPLYNTDLTQSKYNVKPTPFESFLSNTYTTLQNNMQPHTSKNLQSVLGYFLNIDKYDKDIIPSTILEETAYNSNKLKLQHYSLNLQSNLQNNEASFSKFKGFLLNLAQNGKENDFNLILDGMIQNNDINVHHLFKLYTTFAEYEALNINYINTLHDDLTKYKNIASDNTVLLNKYNQIQLDLNNAQKELNTKSQTISTLEQKLKAATDDITKAQTLQISQKSDIDRCNTDLKKIQDEMKNKKPVVEKQCEDVALKERLGELENYLEECSVAKSQQQAQVATLNKNLDDYKTKITTFEKEVSHCNTQLTTLQKDKQQCDATLADATKNVGQACDVVNNQLKTQQDKVQELSIQIEKLQNDAKLTESQCIEDKTTITNALNKNIDELNNKLDNIKEENNKLSQQVQDFEKQYAELQAKYDTTHAQLVAASTNDNAVLVATQADLTAMKKQLDDINDKLKTAQNNLEQTQITLTTCQTDLEQEKQQLQTATKSIDTLNIELTTLKQQKSECEEKLKQKEQQKPVIQEVQCDTTELQAQIDKLTKQYEQEREQLQAITADKTIVNDELKQCRVELVTAQSQQQQQDQAHCEPTECTKEACDPYLIEQSLVDSERMTTLQREVNDLLNKNTQLANTYQKDLALATEALTIAADPYVRSMYDFRQAMDSTPDPLMKLISGAKYTAKHFISENPIIYQAVGFLVLSIVVFIQFAAFMILLPPDVLPKAFLLLVWTAVGGICLMANFTLLATVIGGDVVAGFISFFAPAMMLRARQDKNSLITIS